MKIEKYTVTFLEPEIKIIKGFVEAIYNELK